MGKLPPDKEVLKQLIRKLHQGASPEEVKEEFKEAFKDAAPTAIAQAEEELIKEGMPKEEIHRLCEVHIAAFRESLEREETLAPAGHPLHILMEEHKILLEFAAELKDLSGKMKAKSDFGSVGDEMVELRNLERQLKDSESHYIREENVLFPYLEKHGITQPPAMMWAEHDRIRELEKNLYQLLDTHESMKFQGFVKQLEESAISLAEFLSGHFSKENKILFPTSLEVVVANEWGEIRRQFDELGYPAFTPRTAMVAFGMVEPLSAKKDPPGQVLFETGILTKEEIKSLLNTLPVDITFVDKDDTVRYFSETKERIFPRTKAVIGRTVQLCHPQKSVHLVNQILEDFRAGRREVAEFWINMNDRLVYIRYFPVRDKNGEYLGCVE
ncbi:MAG: histidine kinase, partial [candidate division Zixibacteria bacterium DG_27]